MPWFGFLVQRTVRLGGYWVPGRAPRVESADASARPGTGRDQSRRTPRPQTGAINSELPDGCPEVGGLEHSNRRTGPKTEEYVNSALSGPRCLRRAISNPQRQHSLVGDPGESESIPRAGPGQQGLWPQVSMAGNTGKARQRNHYQSPRSRGVSPAGVIAGSLNRVHININKSSHIAPGDIPRYTLPQFPPKPKRHKAPDSQNQLPPGSRPLGVL